MPSSPLDQRFERACAEAKIPHAVLVATNASGTFHYEKAFGTLAVNSPSPITPDAIMWIASCTKLMTTLAALQCVQRGQLALDAPVGRLLPDLAALPILARIDDTGAPVLIPSKNPITLRLLLTHASGLTYDMLSPPQRAWRRARGQKPSPAAPSVRERYTTPLAFEPGTGFAYGPGVDWAGKLVEAVSGLDLETYLARHVWGPLGIRDMTFDLGKRPDLAARLAGTAERARSGELREKDRASMPYVGADEPMGGQGAFGSPRAFATLLRAVLAAKDEPRLAIGAQLWDQVFTPQLSSSSRDALRNLLSVRGMNRAFAGTPGPADTKDWGLAGLLTLEGAGGAKGDASDGIDGAKSEARDGAITAPKTDHNNAIHTTPAPPAGRAPHTLAWCGMPNLVWWVDRATGLAGLYAGQVLPTGDAVCSDLNRAFEDDVYAAFRAWKVERERGKKRAWGRLERL